MSTFTLEPQYLYKLMSLPRGSQTTKPLSKKCTVPYNSISIDHLGNCILCDCDGWLPLPVGKVLDFETIDHVFSSPSAKMIQDDVSNGNFSWCAIDHCGIRLHDKIPKHLSITINIDESCNLQCPSCRRSHIMVTQGPEYEYKLETIERILYWLKHYNKKIHITLTGNGDPLASHVIRPLMQNWQSNDQQTFTLKTNGLLIKKQLENLNILNQITQYSISVDAGSSEVYKDVRRPGRWDILLENFDFLRSIGKNQITCLNFAFQNKNFNDLPAFIQLCQQYQFRGIVHSIDDWGTWSIVESENKDTWTIKNGIFSDHNVLTKSHVNYENAKKIILDNQHHKNITFSNELMRLIS